MAYIDYTAFTGFDFTDFGNDETKVLTCWVQDFNDRLPFYATSLKDFMNPPWELEPVKPPTLMFPKTNLLANQQYSCFWDALPSYSAAIGLSILTLSSLI